MCMIIRSSNTHMKNNSWQIWKGCKRIMVATGIQEAKLRAKTKSKYNGKSHNWRSDNVMNQPKNLFTVQSCQSAELILGQGLGRRLSQSVSLKWTMHHCHR